MSSRNPKPKKSRNSGLADAKRRRSHNREMPQGGREAGSHRWLQIQLNDPYKLAAQENGWRARSVYKLDYIRSRCGLISSGNVVLDIGAAPGSWSQAARKWTGRSGAVIAVDTQAIEPIEGVETIVGDIRDEETISSIFAATGQRKVDVLLSDVAPASSGINALDVACQINLADIVTDLCSSLLVENGSICIKMFDGAGINEWIADKAAHFKTSKRIRPPATRRGSSEFYFVGTGYHPETIHDPSRSDESVADL